VGVAIYDHREIGLFPELSDRQADNFENSQQLSRTFSGKFTNLAGLFYKSPITLLYFF